MNHRHLSTGQSIPTFWTRDVRGNVIDSRSLSSLHTLIVFLRYAGCPLCNMSILTLNKEYAELKKQGCEVIVFVQSTTENIEKNIFGRHDMAPVFSIISDQEKDTYSLFGVVSNAPRTVGHIAKNARCWVDAATKQGFPQANMDGDLFMVPAAFLVDKKGTLQFVDYNMNFYKDKALSPIYDLLARQDEVVAGSDDK